jgi:hypothetical protein
MLLWWSVIAQEGIPQGLKPRLVSLSAKAKALAYLEAKSSDAQTMSESVVPEIFPQRLKSAA